MPKRKRVLKIIKSIINFFNTFNKNKEENHHIARTKLVAREYYGPQRDRFQNPARFAAAKRK